MSLLLAVMMAFSSLMLSHASPGRCEHAGFISNVRLRLFSSSAASMPIRNRCCASRKMASEDGLADLQNLKAELEKAIGSENYAEAARLRDKIQAKSSDASLGVLGANAEFYRSFREGDIKGMDAVWGDEDNDMVVAVAHPAMPLVTGREKVLETWKGILGGSPPNIRCANTKLVVLADTAWVMTEEVSVVARKHNTAFVCMYAIQHASRLREHVLHALVISCFVTSANTYPT